MRILALVWVVCYLGFLALTFIGIFTSLLWFQQLEKACPAVFDLSDRLVSKSQRLVKYWRYVLAGDYRDLDHPGLQTKCRFLRVFCWLYVVDLGISMLGIFIIKPA